MTWEYMRAIKESTKAISQSWNDLINSMSQTWCEPWNRLMSATFASGSRVKRNKVGNCCLKGRVPHQVSCQNRILEPSPTLKPIWWEKSFHLDRMCFHKLTPWVAETLSEHQALLWHPYLLSITCLHKDVDSVEYLHNHLPSKALLRIYHFLRDYWIIIIL